MTPPGRYIVFEGGEACGKSTQARILAGSLGAVLTREPGATDVGAKLRAILLDPATVDLDHRAEALLMAADRAQHRAEVIDPAIVAGRHVVSDRSAFSSLAYQGFGRGLDLEELRWLSDWALAGRWPDLVILLEVPVAEAARRLGSGLDRMEAAGDGFHRRVDAGFRQMASADRHRWVTVDGTGSIEVVAKAVAAAVADRLQLPA